MAILPVVVGYGGVNPAGRSSFDQGYRRMILESLSLAERAKTLLGLACMTRRVSWDGSHYRDALGQALTVGEAVDRFGGDIEAGTLVRRIEAIYYDPDATFWQKTLVSGPSAAGAMRFEALAVQLPQPLPAGWTVRELSDRKVEVTITDNQEWRVPTTRPMPVKAAGQLPTGFDPGALYNAHFQPRGLQMAVFGATDAIRSMGIPWDRICNAVCPDQIGMYASCAMGQMGDEGLGGMVRARGIGERATAKQVPLGLNSMPADFVNAYVLGSLGHTEAITGACASFLYNLRAAVRDIRSGARRVAVVGGSEAPITPEVMEGFTNMKALATEEAMLRVDGVDGRNPRRYSRPFGENAGFVMGEAAQYLVLMDDALAVELGADIFGAVPDVYINADGIKKSISSPGPGNYLCFGRAVAAARAILGDAAIRQHSFVMAHGSSTPQNRVTESLILDRLAEAFGIEKWPVCAIKAYVGHSLAPASGDQIMAAIGAMRHGWLPGIKTIDAIADDVHRKHLEIPLSDHSFGPPGADVAFINAKGFGGNNATGVLFSARVAQSMVARRQAGGWKGYCARRDTVRALAGDYEHRADRGELAPIYRFGEGVIEDSELLINDREITVPGYGKTVSLCFDNPFGDMV